MHADEMDTYGEGHRQEEGQNCVAGLRRPRFNNTHRASPTMTRRTRQLMLTYRTIQRWKMLKGDIKSAFLQGVASEEQREIFAHPLPELADALGIPRDHPGFKDLLWGKNPL